MMQARWRPSVSPDLPAGWRAGQPNEAQLEQWSGLSFEDEFGRADVDGTLPAHRVAQASWGRHAQRQLLKSQQRRIFRGAEARRRHTSLSAAARDERSYMTGRAQSTRSAIVQSRARLSRGGEGQGEHSRTGTGTKSTRRRAPPKSQPQLLRRRRADIMPLRASTATGHQRPTRQEQRRASREMAAMQAAIRGVKASVVDGYDDEYSAAARASPWSVGGASRTGARRSSGHRSAPAGSMQLSPPPSSAVAPDSEEQLYFGGGSGGDLSSGFMSGQELSSPSMQVDLQPSGFWDFPHDDDHFETDSMATLSSRAGTPELMARRGQSLRLDAAAGEADRTGEPCIHPRPMKHLAAFLRHPHLSRRAARQARRSH
jgi:hypothetical protein